MSALYILIVARWRLGHLRGTYPYQWVICTCNNIDIAPRPQSSPICEINRIDSTDTRRSPGQLIRALVFSLVAISCPAPLLRPRAWYNQGHYSRLRTNPSIYVRMTILAQRGYYKKALNSKTCCKISSIAALLASNNNLLRVRRFPHERTFSCSSREHSEHRAIAQNLEQAKLHPVYQ